MEADETQKTTPCLARLALRVLSFALGIAFASSLGPGVLPSAETRRITCDCGGCTLILFSLAQYVRT